VPAPDGVVVTTGRALAAAEHVLAAAGSADARREARRIAAAVTGRPAGALWLMRDQPLAPELAHRLVAAAAAHAGGEPVAYATGRIGFRTLELDCDARAFIPRPETEGLIDLVLFAGARSLASGGLAADLGTGSGCLALSLAVEGRFERVVAVERDPAAAALARHNVARIRPRTPVDVRDGDWLGPLGDAHYRVIVANPPYLTDAEWEALEPAVRDHEPRAALASGTNGLDATRAILTGARRYLEPGGVVALEIDERRAGAVRDIASSAGWRSVSIHEDLFGRPRYAVVVAEETG